MELIDCYEDLEFLFDAHNRLYLIVDGSGKELYCSSDREKAEYYWEDFCDNDGEALALSEDY